MQGISVRRAAVAGSWYPGTARDLEAAVDDLLAEVTTVAPAPRPIALLSPHAGLIYSGPVAAHAYALLAGSRDLTVVLIGPSHHVALSGSSVWSRGEWETPLGRVPIDETLAAALLAAGDDLVDAPKAHAREHSLEMQLPFLQHLVPGLRLVPVVVGDQGRAHVEALAGALADAVAGRSDVVLVASSDLSHYHPAPRANQLDARVIEAVERFDPASLMERLEAYPGHACGGGPLVAVMTAARRLGATRATVLRYADSGDAGARDKSRVVGYLAAAFTA